MGFLDTIKSALFGNVEGKVGDTLQSIIDQVKPLISEGKLSETIQSAVSNYGDLSTQLKNVMSKLSTASADAKTGLTTEKNDIVKQIKEKGTALLDAAAKEDALPDTLQSLCANAKTWLKKL